MGAAEGAKAVKAAHEVEQAKKESQVKRIDSD
jgi:hypothetical protein